MSKGRFHDQPFDEGTLTKLDIFELYAREWFPVFLSKASPPYSTIHVFDFFAGPGTDSEGTYGSPLRLIRRLREHVERPGFSNVQIHLHFFDQSKKKAERLSANVARTGPLPANVFLDIRAIEFDDAFVECLPILSDASVAKLALLDQFGVGRVNDEVFAALVKAATCDFLFFIASAILHRFREHPLIKQKIVRPDDYYHVHRAVFGYYRELLPQTRAYYLAPFSIKKGANIYGIIFGSAHPLGIDKFLQVAWHSDAISGEADFDIHRDNFSVDEPKLPFRELRPRKIVAFEQDLEAALRQRMLRNEIDVMQICYQHGVTRKHAAAVLKRLKQQGVIEIDFRVPNLERLNSPRPILCK